MRASQLPLFTEKEDPKDAQVISHRLLVRAGYVKKQASGFYAFLPFGYLVHRKIEEIIRKNMNAFGGCEVHLPVLTSAELWQQSGRWSQMGAEMMRMSDRHQNEFALGPTHEESITWLANQYLKSYKQLPINLYQIGTKYRDEIRPRYGLIRGREFVMKDAYSFHSDETSLDETYQNMRKCYRAIFDQCGLETLAVEADSGAMGGSGSEEFMVASNIGEETLLICGKCDYRSNQEKTPFLGKYKQEKSSRPFEAVHTPNAFTVEDVAKLLKLSQENFIKSLVYENADFVVMAFIPGDRDLSEIKLRNQTGLSDIELANENTIKTVTGAAVGFAGPANLPFKADEVIKLGDSEKKLIFIFDSNLQGRGQLVSGANKDDHHNIELQEGRDFDASPNADLVLAEESDPCPKCQSELQATKGIEVGHIFKLGDKYTQALKVSVLDQQGKARVPTMGCYGIGVGRTMQTIVEQNHDEKGIIWPEAVSPFKYYLIAIAKGDEELQKAEDFYQSLISKGISVFYDDRKERPGVKFNDADLVGFNYQLVLGKAFFASGKIEFKDRRSEEKKEITAEEIN